MKLNKIFAVALAVLAMTSCDDNKAEDYPAFLGAVNTASGVTVSLPQTFEFAESAGFVNVPVIVNGETNGKVVVTVEVKELTELPAETESAVEGTHYNVTSNTVNVAPGVAEGGIEVSSIWETGVINNDRVFEMSIVSAEGAVVENASCVVTITNADDPFTAMYGKWKFTAAASNTTKEFVLTVGGPDPTDTEYYGKELYAYGLRGYEFVFLPLNFEYDVIAGAPVLSIQTATFATGSLLNFTGIGNSVVVGIADDATETNPFGNDIPMVYTKEGDKETIKMADMNQTWSLGVMPYPALNAIAGYWGTWQGITLSR